MKSSITSRLILFLTLSAGAILVLGLLIDYRLTRQQLLQRLVADSQRTVVEVVRDLERLLRGVENSTYLLGSILERQSPGLEALDQLLRDSVAHNDDVFGAAIALQPGWAESPGGFAPYYYKTPHGLARTDFAAGDRPAPYWQLSWYTAAATSGAATWTEPYFDSGGAEVYMTTYSLPVFREDERGNLRLYGVVTADVTLRELQRYLQRLQLGASGMGMLVSDTGLALSSRGSSARPRTLEEQIPDPESARRWLALFQRATPDSSELQRLHCEQLAGPCMVRVTRLQHTGWIVGVVFSEREVLAPLRAFQYRSLGVGLLSLLTMALAVRLVIRRITWPLALLARTADEFGEGNFDAALPTVHGQDEVARLVRSFTRMKGELKHYVADLEQATASRSRLEGELSAAREIQMSMLPQRGEASEQERDFALWATVRPARTVGGDLFTYNLVGRRLYFAVGDVSDKGVPAALFMARALSNLQQLTGGPPGAMLAEVNNALVQHNDNCMFLTLLLGVLDLDTLELNWASAGHTAPVLLRAGLVSALPQHTGPATGLAPHQVFPDNPLQLAPGDRLAVYTDGIVEAFSRRGEMFGAHRLGSQLAATRERSLAAAGHTLLEVIQDFAAASPQSDDITLLLLEIPQEAPRVREQFTLGPGLSGRCARWLQEALAGSVGSTLQGELQLVLEETVTNIQKYAGLGPGATLEVELTLAPEEVVLRVRDPGAPFNPLAQSRRAELGEDIARTEVGGLGVHLIVSFTDWQRYRRQGGWNCLELGRRREPPSATAGPGRAAPGARGPVTTAHNEEPPMKLSTSVDFRPDRSMARILLKGALNSDTAPGFEQQLLEVLEEGMALNVLDMRDLDYISSAGLRVIFKAAKQAAKDGQHLAASNRKPHIEKVFEILKALPDMTVFASDQELDDYLDAMQARSR